MMKRSISVTTPATEHCKRETLRRRTRRRRRLAARQGTTPLAMEMLEDRRMLALSVPLFGTGGFVLDAVEFLVNLAPIDSDVKDTLVRELDKIGDDIRDVSVLYTGLPGETNNLKVTSSLANFFLVHPAEA